MAKPLPRQTDHSGAVAEITAWLIDQGLAGAPQEAVVEGYCERLVGAGLPVERVHLAQRSLHPVFGGLGFDWYRSSGVMRDYYARTDTPVEEWSHSPFYYMLEEGISELRERLAETEAPHRFPILDEFRAKGGTDYLAMMLPLSPATQGGGYDPNDPPEGIVISWTSDAAGGFSDADIAVLRELLRPLALTLKAASNHQMAVDLLETYLGPDAGARVLSGEIRRGSLQTIHAVIWYFDLQSFTRLAERTAGAAIIAMLNDYFGTVVSVIEEHGGNVLKFMGDGLLAIFSFDDQEDARRSALEASAALRVAMAETNRRREAEDLPRTGFNLALHAGNVLYGNIGAEHRLDFTIIGSAVNVTARILGMCRSLEQELIVSSQVARPAMAQRDDIVSLGRHMLRGVPEPQELFTLYAPPMAPDPEASG